MKSVAKLFYGPTVFLGFMAVVYIFGTQYLRDTDNTINESQSRLEQANATGLTLAALMTLMLGGYFRFAGCRSDITPSNFEEAETADSIDTLGFFSVSSTWSLVVTVGILLMGYDIAFMAYQLVILGTVVLIVADAKLNTRYITPPEKHQSECNWVESRSQITEKSLPPAGLLVREILS